MATGPLVWRAIVSPSSCVTTAAAPSVPMKTSSQSAAPKRVRRALAKNSAAMNAAGKKARKQTSANEGNAARPWWAPM